MGRNQNTEKRNEILTRFLECLENNKDFPAYDVLINEYHTGKNVISEIKKEAIERYQREKEAQKLKVGCITYAKNTLEVEKPIINPPKLPISEDNPQLLLKALHRRISQLKMNGKNGILAELDYIMKLME